MRCECKGESNKRVTKVDKRQSTKQKMQRRFLRGPEGLSVSCHVSLQWIIRPPKHGTDLCNAPMDFTIASEMSKLGKVPNFGCNSGRDLS